MNKQQQARLLEIARASIEHGLQHESALQPKMAELEPALCDDGASFVTLHKDGQLRGCIGSLEAHRPLAQDVASNAFNAAFRDPRFNPVRHDELDSLELEISVLGKPEPLAFDSQEDLVTRLRPGVDGLILELGTQRGTFLPSVWKSLPEPVDFLRQLKRKAGLPADYWSDDIKMWRYTTESFGRAPWS